MSSEDLNIQSSLMLLSASRSARLPLGQCSTTRAKIPESKKRPTYRFRFSCRISLNWSGQMKNKTCFHVSMFSFPPGLGRAFWNLLHPALYTFCSSTWFPALHTYSSYKPVSHFTHHQFIVSFLVVTLSAAWSRDCDKRIFLTPAWTGTFALTYLFCVSSLIPVVSSNLFHSPVSSSVCFCFFLSLFVSE